MKKADPNRITRIAVKIGRSIFFSFSLSFSMMLLLDLSRKLMSDEVLPATSTDLGLFDTSMDASRRIQELRKLKSQNANENQMENAVVGEIRKVRQTAPITRPTYIENPRNIRDPLLITPRDEISPVRDAPRDSTADPRRVPTTRPSGDGRDTRPPSTTSGSETPPRR